MKNLASLLYCSLFFAASGVGKDMAPYEFKKFYDISHLVKVEIQLKESDWDRLRVQHRLLVKTLRTDIPPTDQAKQFDYFPAQLKIDGVELGKVAIRKKGFVGSLDVNRPSLKIQIDRFDKKKMFAGVDTLTLNNNRQDPTRIHQLLGYQLFRKAGIPASYCNLAHVTVNGKSLGIYSNVESLDKHLFRRAFKNAKGTLYEGTIADFVSPSLVRFERKFGSKKADKILKKISLALKLDNKKTLKELGRYLDLESFYSFWAMEVLLGHWDGYVSNKNNYFIYFDSKSDRLSFLPWGLDQLATDRNMFWRRDFDPPKSIKADAAIPRRLYDHPESQKYYFEVLRLLLDEIWVEDKLISQIDDLYKMIEPYLVDLNSRTKDSVEKLNKFIKNRRTEIMEEISNGAVPDWTLDPRPMMGEIVKVADITGRFSLELSENEKDQFGFVSVKGQGNLPLKMGKKKIDFNNLLFAIRQNGRRSVTLRISSADALKGNPNAIEITFPRSRLDDNKSDLSYRIDIFASPAQGGIFITDTRDQFARLAGKIVLTSFGLEQGDKIEGRIDSEAFRFLPPKNEQ
ncbi:MAG: hypothetical protein CMO44_16150 [Verrucomicrobiales bacterium]|nr:hypothetical protein [Verrucomicrobiales bacterium]